jgi:DNA primase
LAAYIPDEKITAIKNASDIVDIVSEVVSLRKQGVTYWDYALFTLKKPPPLRSARKSRFFTASVAVLAGTVFDFLMKHNGLTFPEAARALANRYGIDLPTRKMSPAEKKKLTERETILTLNAEAMTFYQDCLYDAGVGKEGHGLLTEKGDGKKTIDFFNWDSRRTVGAT